MGNFGGLGPHVQLIGTNVRPIRMSNTGQYMEGSPSYERHRTISSVATPMVVIVGGTVVLQNESIEDAGRGLWFHIEEGNWYQD